MMSLHQPFERRSNAKLLKQLVLRSKTYRGDWFDQFDMSINDKQPYLRKKNKINSKMSYLF